MPAHPRRPSIRRSTTAAPTATATPDRRPQAALRRAARGRPGCAMPAPPPTSITARRAPAEREAIAPRLDDPWLAEELESRVIGHAVQHLVPRELDEVRARRLPQIDKIEREVQARLKREIELLGPPRPGPERPGARRQAAAHEPGSAPQARADELAERLQRRMAELARERDISALPPVVLAGALVVPIGLLRDAGRRRRRRGAAEPEVDPARRAEIERLAMDAVMAAERSARLRAARRQPRQLRLRHRIPRPRRHRPPPLHRGQGPRPRQRPRDHHPQRAAAGQELRRVAPARHRPG